MRPVFLIGYMGCGKTTLGEELARQMQLRYIDLDDFIEAKCGMSIVEIFDEMGENRFRELETAALREVATMTGVIIGCGGGTPCHPTTPSSLWWSRNWPSAIPIIPKPNCSSTPPTSRQQPPPSAPRAASPVCCSNSCSCIGNGRLASRVPFWFGFCPYGKKTVILQSINNRFNGRRQAQVVCSVAGDRTWHL